MAVFQPTSPLLRPGFNAGKVNLSHSSGGLSHMGQNRKQPISIWSFRSARDSGRSDEVNLTAGSDAKPVDALGCRSSEMEPIPSPATDRGSTTRTSERSRLQIRGIPSVQKPRASSRSARAADRPAAASAAHGQLRRYDFPREPTARLAKAPARRRRSRCCARRSAAPAARSARASRYRWPPRQGT